MTKQEIAKIYHLPFTELAELAKNPSDLVNIINISIGIGIRMGREQTHRYYNQMFRDYNEVSIKN